MCTLKALLHPEWGVRYHFWSFCMGGCGVLVVWPRKDFKGWNGEEFCPEEFDDFKACFYAKVCGFAELFNAWVCVHWPLNTRASSEVSVLRSGITYRWGWEVVWHVHSMSRLTLCWGMRGVRCHAMLRNLDASHDKIFGEWYHELGMLDRLSLLRNGWLYDHILGLGLLGKAETLWGGKPTNGPVHAGRKKLGCWCHVKTLEWRLSEMFSVACETVDFVLIMLIKSHG